MQQTIALRIIAALGLASTAVAIPAHLVARIQKMNVGTQLAARQDDPSYGGSAVTWDSSTCQGAGNHEAYLTFASCSTCSPVTDVDDEPDCDESVWISSHDTPSNWGNDYCNNYIEIDDDFDGCSASVDSYSISTPNGWGNFVPNNNCNSPDGTITGAITTADGYEMICQYYGVDAHPWTSWCGVSSTQCSGFLQCVGLNSAQVCP